MAAQLKVGDTVYVAYLNDDGAPEVHGPLVITQFRGVWSNFAEPGVPPDPDRSPPPSSCTTKLVRRTARGAKMRLAQQLREEADRVYAWALGRD